MLFPINVLYPVYTPRVRMTMIGLNYFSYGLNITFRTRVTQIYGFRMLLGLYYAFAWRGT